MLHNISFKMHTIQSKLPDLHSEIIYSYLTYSSNYFDSWLSDTTQNGAQSLKSPQKANEMLGAQSLLGPPRKVSRIVMAEPVPQRLANFIQSDQDQCGDSGYFSSCIWKFIWGNYLFSGSWMSCLNLHFLIYKMGIEIHYLFRQGQCQVQDFV